MKDNNNDNKDALSLNEIIDFTKYFCKKHHSPFDMDKVLDLWNDERDFLIDTTVKTMMQEFSNKRKRMKDVSLVEAMSKVRMTKDMEHSDKSTTIVVEVYIDTDAGRDNKLHLSETVEMDEVLDADEANELADDLAFQMTGRILMDWIGVIKENNNEG